MRFLYVDKIVAMDGDEIRGMRHFPQAEPLRYEAAGAGGTVAPGAVSEAIGQLASWLCLSRNDFTARPVFLFADAIKVETAVRTGAAVDLSATMHSMDSETLVFSGEAKVDGKVVQRLDNCSGYFMPLGDLEDPAVTRERFAALTSESGLTLSGAEGEAFPFALLAGETLSHSTGEIRTQLVLSPSHPFYKDHFPRFPVTPIVMLNEMIGAAATRLLVDGSSGERLVVRAIRDIKIKSFVKPGETVETRIRADQPVTDGATGVRQVRTVAELLKDGKRILRGQYDFEIHKAPVESFG